MEQRRRVASHGRDAADQGRPRRRSVEGTPGTGGARDRYLYASPRGGGVGGASSRRPPKAPPAGQASGGGPRRPSFDVSESMDYY